METEQMTERFRTRMQTQMGKIPTIPIQIQEKKSRFRSRKTIPERTAAYRIVIRTRPKTAERPKRGILRVGLRTVGRHLMAELPIVGRLMAGLRTVGLRIMEHLIADLRTAGRLTAALLTAVPIRGTLWYRQRL